MTLLILLFFVGTIAYLGVLVWIVRDIWTSGMPPLWRALICVAVVIHPFLGPLSWWLFGGWLRNAHVRRG